MKCLRAGAWKVSRNPPPFCTFYFESYDTMLFQVQEMLLIEKGGADLIIIYNSGRYRMAGRGSLAGPVSVGVVVQNVGSVSAIAEVFETGLPLVERIVTVSGHGLRKPANLIVPVGTKLRDLLACRSIKQEIGVDHDPSVRHSHRGPEPAARVRPEQRAGRGVERMHCAVRVNRVDSAVGNRWRRLRGKAAVGESDHPCVDNAALTALPGPGGA